MLFCNGCNKPMGKPAKNKLKRRPNWTGLCRKCYLSNPLSGKNAPWWSGGKSKDRGYIVIALSGIEDEGLRELCRRSVENRSWGKCRSGRTYEHHMVMVNHINRPLKKGEVVHHVNGDKSDNRLENLELATQKDNLRAHKELFFENKVLKREIVRLKKELQGTYNHIKRQSELCRDT